MSIKYNNKNCIVDTNEPIEAIISSDCNKNIYPTEFGSLTKIRGYKTFKGAINQLKRINKLNKKFGFKAVYTITLPLK